jgi:hypothetical protein
VLPPFVEKVEGGRRGHPGKGGNMTEYLIAFNDEWVPDHTVEELREKSKVLKPLVAEMKAAGVLIFTGGLDDVVERHAAVHRRSVRRDQGTPRRLRRRGCGRRGGGAAVGGKDRGGLRLAAGGATLPCAHATSRDFLTESAGVPTARLYHLFL